MTSHNLESIEHSISTLTEHFNERMADFQRVIQTSIPATSPSSNIGAQFGAFRAFVMSSLESLQLQVQFLSKQCDNMEMRSRKKMLMVHGVPEVQKENVTSSVVEALSKHLDLSSLAVSDFSFCKRIGQPKEGKARAILVRFCDLSLRNKIWFTKTRLKGTGVTLSEFLTRERHEAFQAARQKFGITRCWTRDGLITILGLDGKRHTVSTIAEVKLIGGDNTSPTAAPGGRAIPQTSQATATVGHSSIAVPVPRNARAQTSRSRKDVRK